MRSDNGAPFASVGIQGLSKLSVRWLKLGIRLGRIEPGEAQQNGRHQRMHRTLKQETTQPAARTVREQQQRFDAFQREYNEQRPHEALEFTTPVSQYRASTRRYPVRVPDVEYPAHFAQRTVDSSGDLTWSYSKCFVGRALAGERVGIEEAGDGLWRVWFAAAASVSALGSASGRPGPVRKKKCKMCYLCR